MSPGNPESSGKECQGLFTKWVWVREGVGVIAEFTKHKGLWESTSQCIWDLEWFQETARPLFFFSALSLFRQIHSLLLTLQLSALTILLQVGSPKWCRWTFVLNQDTSATLYLQSEVHRPNKYFSILTEKKLIQTYLWYFCVVHHRVLLKHRLVC